MIAHPTEGVFGLNCRPDDAAAVLRVLEIKDRDPLQGLLLIGASLDQFDGWIDLPPNTPDLRGSAERPVTWIVPATEAVPLWIRGRHDSVAIRIVSHTIAAGLCRNAGMPLVSTSANISGRTPARTAYVLRNQFRELVDFIVPGRCGPARGPSEIRDLSSGQIVRASGR
ncbi:MAG: Sua5/YciO/YrdC/YwlC family protein [Halioglobus sp.]|nr:Sua5/YciO/YrdC/YwlC family protein [Halioglobus sp.]